MQHTVVQVMYQLWQRRRQRGYSHQMWHDDGRGLVKGNMARPASNHGDCKSSPTI